MIFNVSTVNLINTLFISAGIGVCSLCLMQITASIHIRKDVRRYFQLFFSLILLYISTHLARQFMDGVSGEAVRVIQYIVTFVEITSAGVTTFLMSVLIAEVASPDKKLKAVEYFFLALAICHVLALAVSAPFDFIYYFDRENVYHRGTGYLLSNLCPVIMLVTDTVLLIKYRKNIKPRVKIAFWNYLIAPIIAIILQIPLVGIQFIIFATVGASVYMFSVIVQDQNERYQEQRVQSSRIESELELASNIQADMLPSIYPAFPDRKEFEIYASMDPAKEVGGDFYDFFLVDDDHLCMVMADVSGKGVPAALFMMATKIILANNAMLGKSPAAILTDTNSAICSNNREEMFVTVWLGILELSTGKLVAANAGHEYPVMKTPDGNFEVVKDKHGFVIGGMAGAKYTEYELTMEAGAKLFLYTDGVPEATNSQNELFGIERTLTALNENKGLSPEQLLKAVRRSVDGFVNGAEQFDDLTMLGLEYKGKNA